MSAIQFGIIFIILVTFLLYYKVLNSLYTLVVPKCVEESWDNHTLLMQYAIEQNAMNKRLIFPNSTLHALILQMESNSVPSKYASKTSKGTPVHSKSCWMVGIMRAWQIKGTDWQRVADSKICKREEITILVRSKTKLTTSVAHPLPGEIRKDPRQHCESCLIEASLHRHDK